MGARQLKIISMKKWYKFTKRYPKLESQLDEAIVKEIDDYHYLINLEIIKTILRNSGQSTNFDL